MYRIHLLAMLLAVSSAGAAQMTGISTGVGPQRRSWRMEADCLTILVGGEELSAYEAYTEANRLIIEQNWAKAEAILETMMGADVDNRNLAYKRALCLRAIKGRLEEAVPLAMLAIRGEFAKRYNPFDVEVTLPPESALDIALEVLQFSGHYPEAQAVAKTMMNRYPERMILHDKAKQAMADCAFAMGCISDPQRMDIQEEGGCSTAQGSADYADPCCLHRWRVLSISRLTVVKPVRTRRRRGESSVLLPLDGSFQLVQVLRKSKETGQPRKGHDHCGHPRG